MKPDYAGRGGPEEGGLSRRSVRSVKIGGKRAIFAAGCSAAMRLADGNGEGVELAENLRVGGSRIVDESVAREICECVVGDAAAARRRRKKQVALGDAAKILIGHGNGVTERIKEDGVGGLGTYTGQSQKALAQRRRGCCGEGCERAAEFFVEHSEECLECGRFAREEAGGPDETAQFGERNVTQAIGRERTGCAEVGKGAFDGLPCCVLREISAKNHLKLRPGRPPALRAIGLEQELVHAAQARRWIGLSAEAHGSL